MTILKDMAKTEGSTTMGKSIYIARQAIFCADMNVYAYELLFRNSDKNAATIDDENQATSKLIINTFVELGVDDIANTKPVFINLTRDFLVGDIKMPFESDRVVLEVLEDIEADPECIEGIKRLSEKGFTIALDDFFITDKTYDLISFADIVKVDILAMDENELRKQVDMLKAFPVKLLAEKVETSEEYELCKELGFEYFQGYFFCKPKIIKGQELPVNKISILEMLAMLQNPDCEYDDIEEIVKKDVSISFKLLKIINSPIYGRVNKVNSVKETLVILGLETLKHWITLLSFSMIDDKPEELINISLVRAKMCEQLADHFKIEKSAAFTTGLFSLLDALMDQPIDSLIEDLPLSDDIVQALTESDGNLGKLLKIVSIYEKGNMKLMPKRILETVDLKEMYMNAVKWADELSATLK